MCLRSASSVVEFEIDRPRIAARRDLFLACAMSTEDEGACLRRRGVSAGSEDEGEEWQNPDSHRESVRFRPVSAARLDEEKRLPVFTTGRIMGGIALFVAAGLILLQRACFDIPIQTPIDLEDKGVQVLRTITFRHPEQGYAYGLAFTPSFVDGRDWRYRTGFEEDKKRAWAELSPTIDVAITDSSGVIRMREISRISSETGWTITNGSQEDRPASVYKFITFTPVVGERYQVRVYVVQDCAGSNALSPVFFIELPTAGP
jgi:hypothetical protein